MKKLLATLISIFVLYVIYYDLSVGTLSKPTSIVLLSSQSQPQETTKKMTDIGKETKAINMPATTDQGLYFKEVKVAGGSTVISIVEQLQNGPLPVSIAQLIMDFEELNPNVKPESIQIGKVYKFPIYPELGNDQ